MDNLIMGIVLVLIGVASLLENAGVVELVAWWQGLSPILIVLIGVFIVSRAWSHMGRHRAVKKDARKLQQTNVKLEQELEQKEKTVQQQGEVIDDLVSPKSDPLKEVRDQ